jgi:putative phage-type endonuclease
MRELSGPPQSDRWIKNRVGRITGSRMADVMNVLTRKSKSGEAGEPGAKRINYRRELVAERILGRAASHFVTRYMEEGSEREDEARSMYEMATEQLVIPCGFVLHPQFDFAGATPDGLVGDGILEIKSPKPETLLEWMETGEVPDEYQKQCQWEMVCCERQWADFYGWYPGLPHFFKRIDRDEELIAQMESESERLHLEIETFLAKNGLPPTIWNDPAPEPADDDKSFEDACAWLDEIEVIP